MEGRLLFKGCSIFHGDGRVRRHMAVVVEAGRITRVAADGEVPALPGDWAVNSRGRLLSAGLVDCHSHLVNAQLLPPSGEVYLRPVRARLALQERLDSQLTASEVEVLTAYGLAVAARQGITLVNEHLHAPAAVGEVLAVQGRVAERIGLRLVSSHASRGTNGGEAAGIAQLEANAEYARSRRDHPHVRGALGFHASSTCGDELLRRVGRIREEQGLGVHFHLSESEDDLTTTYAKHGRRIVARLESFGVLAAGAVAAFARSVDRSEADRLAQTRTLLALSPRLSLAMDLSDSLEALLSQHNLVGLGSAGVGALREELFCALAGVLRIARAGRLIDPDGLMSHLLVGAPAELCSMLFGVPSGTVEEGALADLVLHDFIPPDAAALGATPALLLQLGNTPVAWTVVHGRVVVREGQLLGHDFLALAQEAARVVTGLWERAAA